MKLGINKELSKYLKSCRIKSGLTQIQLSRACKIKAPNAQYCSNFERAKCVPSNELIRAYIKLCGANVDSLAEIIEEQFYQVFKGKKK